MNEAGNESASDSDTEYHAFTDSDLEVDEMAITVRGPHFGSPYKEAEKIFLGLSFGADVETCDAYAWLTVVACETAVQKHGWQINDLVTSVMPKRRRQSKRRADDANAGIDPGPALPNTGIDDGWLQKLTALDKGQVIQIVSHIMNICSIDEKSVKKARVELPSFSTAKWADFAEKAGLPKDPSNIEFKTVNIPTYQLPPSFHKAVFENSWRTQDVYQEMVVRSREESIGKRLDPYLVPILALFQGRVIDKPEEAMPANAYATGVEVEHEIVMVGGILFLVVEAKSHAIDKNNLAQLFLELLSAAEINNDAHFKELRIYGILMNLGQFSFYSYDPIPGAFGRDEDIFVDSRRDTFSTWMIYVSNKIFGLVLSAFMEGLRAITEKSKEKAKGEGFDDDSSPPYQIAASTSTQPAASKGKRKSTEGWELALHTAEECCQKFKESVTSVEEMEIRSTEALDILTRSVRSIPRFSAYTSAQGSTTLTPAELKDHARITVENAMQIYLR